MTSPAADEVDLIVSGRVAWKEVPIDGQGRKLVSATPGECADYIAKLAAQVEALTRSRDESLRMLAAVRNGQTVTFPRVEFDLSPAMVESKLRDKLIELGWKAPEDAARGEAKS